MARKLPWKKTTASTPVATPSRNPTTPLSSASLGSASFSRRSAPVSASTSTPKRPARAGHAIRRGRSKSTSPPPAPPSESFMIEGADNDDKYRMVEDELVSIAGAFTAHLHAAEYHRLKALAKSENAETIRNISRPVSRPATDLVKQRQKARDLDARQQKGLKRALGRGGDDMSESPWAGTSLQGLMESPRKKAVPLPIPHASTRAAAGYQEQSPSKPSVLPFTIRSKEQVSSLSTAELSTTTRADNRGAYESGGTGDDLDQPSPPAKQQSRAARQAVYGRPPNPVAASPSGRYAIGIPSNTAEFEEDEEGPDSIDFLRRSRERRAAQRARRSTDKATHGVEVKQENEDAMLDVIPSFL